MDSRTFSNFLSDLVIKNKDFKKQVLDLSRDVVRGKYIDCESSLENEEVIDVCVSYDGTCQKRGHTSLDAIGIVIDILSGLVIDFEVLIVRIVSIVKACLVKILQSFAFGMVPIKLVVKKILMDHRTAWR
ncbi:hypothetical protein AVEN_135341-1 [Araneus ventricosus]|uniref:Uncharacterized protein n=1 Tax=Araneus ventricosus TaxID=182803 RepID=A0A4Y2KSV9_ARAVE|nr:hypothetical protein AVEN_135341-1 [Araneus ventricosus]